MKRSLHVDGPTVADLRRTLDELALLQVPDTATVRIKVKPSLSPDGGAPTQVTATSD